MAKSLSFFGLRSGSTKSHTYQVYRGQQITKDRVSHVSNPQTSGQMYQRLKLVAIAAAASRLSGLINHSWEGVEYGYKSIAEFRRRALTISAGQKLTSFVPKGLSDPGLMAWPLSSGTLLGVKYQMNPQAGGNILFKPVIIDPEDLTGDIGTDTTIKIAESSDLVYDYLCKLFNLDSSKRCQISFVRQQVYSNDPITYATGKNTTAVFYRSFFSICRLILDKSKKEDSADWTYKVTTEEGKAVVTLTSEELNQSIVINMPSDATTEQWLGTSSFTALNDIGAYPVLGGAIICSQEDDTIWRRSNAYLAISRPSVTYWTSYNNAIYGYLKDKSESDKYLNTGSESTNLVTA